MGPSTPPPQSPPAGWYSDPEGSGLRWWDGTRWTEQVRDKPQPGASQPPPGAETVSGGQPREPCSADSGGIGNRRRLFFGGAVVAILLAAGAALAFSMGGGDSRAAYENCRRQTQPVFASIEDLRSHLDVGVVQSDYAHEVGDANATYHRFAASNPETPCQPVATALGEAMDSYAEASSEWNECIVEAEEFCGETDTQALWLDADRAATRARHRLNALTGGADAVAAATTEAAHVEADALAKEQMHTAQVAIETYATNHRGSYEGATPAKLRQIEPTLPSSLEVREAGLEYFSISVGSKNGNWFEIDREFDGELTFKCGEPGDAGCPGSGEWG